MPVDPVQALIREINDLKRRIKTLETAPSQQNMTVDRGATRILSPEGLTIGAPGNTAGSQVVYGRLTIDGVMDGEGDFDWSGSWDFSGPGSMTGDITATGAITATGEWTQNGEWHLNGDGDITGDVGITGILTVAGTGRVIVGGMMLDPADGGGSVAFPGGAKVQADPGGGIRMIVGTNRVYVGSGLVTMQMGTRSISISASGIQMSGLDTIPSSLANGAAAGTTWSDGSKLYRVVTG